LGGVERGDVDDAAGGSGEGDGVDAAEFVEIATLE